MDAPEEPYVEVDEFDGVAVVRPFGEFDISSADMLRAHLVEAVGPTSNRVVIDLAGTTFVDSIAIGVILGAARRVDEHHGWVRVASPLPHVRQVLRVTGLDKVFAIFESVESALLGSGALGAPETV